MGQGVTVEGEIENAISLFLIRNDSHTYCLVNLGSAKR